MNTRDQLVCELKKEGSDHWCEIRGFSKCLLFQTRKKSLWSELGGGGYRWSETSVESEGEIASVGATLIKLAGKERGNVGLIATC